MLSLTTHRLLRRRWLAGVLALVMLTMQAAGVLHKLDFENHPAGLVCATCVAFANADSPLAAVTGDASIRSIANSEFPDAIHSPVTPALLQSRARGPPVLV